MKNEQNQKFILKDFYLAAFLKAKGFRLLKIEWDRDNPRRALFVFEDAENRQSLVEDFLFGRAQVEAKSFVLAIKELKQLLHLKL